MEKFRKKLKTHIVIGVTYCAIHALLINALHIFLPNMPYAVDKQFNIGIFSGIAIVVISYIVRNISALQNEDKLKELYIKENDERTKSIEAAAGKTGIKIVLAGLALAMVIAANINKFVFFSLMGAVIFTVIVMAATNIFYNRKL